MTIGLAIQGNWSFNNKLLISVGSINLTYRNGLDNNNSRCHIGTGRRRIGTPLYQKGDQGRNDS